MQKPDQSSRRHNQSPKVQLQYKYNKVNHEANVRKMPSNVIRQTMALMRRYLLALLTKPISSFMRLILWPGFILGLGFYISSNADPEITADSSLISYQPFVLLITTTFIIYSYCDWMIKDRATGIKSLMLSMGLKRSSYYFANVIIMLLSLIVIIATVAFISMKYLLIGSNSSKFAICILFILFALQIIAFAHVVVSFVTSTSYSGIVLFLLLFEQAPSLLFDLGMSNGGNWRPFLIFLDTLSPFGAMRIFGKSYMMNKNNGSIDYDPRKGFVSAPTYLLILYSLIWTTILFAIARWFEEVCPWQTDSAIKSPCFCFNTEDQYGEIEEVEDTEAVAVSYGSQKYFEQRRNENRDTGIRVSCVSKNFKSVPAVNNVSFNIYKGETTLLLGHNGAGKSTLMNMILGLQMPDSGRIGIKNFNSSGRSTVGVCPQTSVLDEDLTVKQHLEFFVDIKSSMSSHERNLHVKQTLDDINLTNHANKRPAELSGGMKRKLSLGLAFVGKSNVLILDEPSSGLDPDSRVFIWNAIRRNRTNRTVLLSTQHMEEADYLGDRIAIMSTGRIICCGSSLFLTKLFGKGYKLRVECLKSKRQEILDLIGRHFEQAKLVDLTSTSDDNKTTTSNSPVKSPTHNTKSQKDKIIDFVVELTTSHDAEMEIIKLLEFFETDGERSGIRSYGLKSSSVEDVMLNTNKYFVNETKESQTKLTLNTTANHVATLVNSGSSRGTSSICLQIYALIVKIFFTYYNDYKTFIFYRILLSGFAIYLAVSNIFQPIYRPNLVSLMIIYHLIYYPVLERTTKFKTMQLTSHLKITTYWICFYIMDMISLIINLITLNVLLLFCLPSGIKILKDLHLIMSLALIAFYVAALSFAYMLSMVMNDPKAALGYHVIIYMISLFTWVVIQLIGLAFPASKLGLEKITYIGVALLPNDAFQYIIASLSHEGFIAPKDKLFALLTSNIDGPSMWIGFVALLMQTIVYSFLLALAERQNIDLDYYTRIRNIYRLCFGKDDVRIQQDMDPDVLEETKKALTEIDQVPKGQTTLDAVQSVGIQENYFSLIAANLGKSYIRGIKVVEQLSFTVHGGECFGLLGVNGAGKTTTFSMIVAETKPDNGKVWANGYYVNENVDKFRKHLGYDPQASPDLLLTAYQALYLMARLRGLYEHSIPMLVDSVCELLDMSEHKHKLAGNLSGGTKRKLALGMSLIGAPRLLALDEPTAGVDPLARRGIWKLLKSLRKQNKVSIVISSHAMEECEAICDRISIMARGRLRCIGSFLHLRSKFAHGCSLRIQIASTSTIATKRLADESANQTGSHSQPPSSSSTAATHNNGSGRQSHKGTTTATGGGENEQIDLIVAELQQQLEAAIGSSVLKLVDKNVNSATFNITDNRVRRSILFRIMREFKQKHASLNLSYTLNDSSLEDIFISLAREQLELENPGQQQQQQPHQ